MSGLAERLLMKSYSALSISCQDRVECQAGARFRMRSISAEKVAKDVQGWLVREYRRLSAERFGVARVLAANGKD